LFGDLFFKLEEEKLALLLHLPKVFAETAVLTLASGLGCSLVVETLQAAEGKTGLFWSAVKAANGSL
jgi:hypothetical protein